MTGHHRSLPQVTTLLWAVGIAASVGGCGRTLVFAERDGVNLAIRANASSSPPIEVNFGLNRTVATIVPPAGESGGHPNGEAVSMFAGFQVENNLDPAKPLAADVKIDTQFASGAAAKSVAGNPTVVAHIVNVGSVTIQRTLEFANTLTDRTQLLAAVNGLSDDQAVAVATSILPALSTRKPELQQALAPQVAALPPNGKISPAAARNILSQWATMEDVTPKNAAQWATALAQARQ
jgi:hypothetical protein